MIRGRLASLAREHGIPIALYTLLALLMTYPLVLQWTTAVPGDGVDSWQNMWNMWWLKRALLEGHNPFTTTMIYYPQGASLLLHTLNPFNFIISLPVHAIFGLVVAYNTALIFSLVAGGYGAYLVARDVTQDSRSALLAGGVFSCSSYILAQALGHLNLIAAEWIPFAVLALRYASTSPSIKTIGIAGLCMAINVSCDWQYYLFILLWGGWYALAIFWYGRTLRAVMPVVAAIGVSLVLVLPVLIPTAALARETPRADTGDSYRIGTSADLTDFLIPSQLHPLWGDVSAQAQVYKADSIIHNKTAYLGSVALALAVFGLWGHMRQKHTSAFPAPNSPASSVPTPITGQGETAADSRPPPSVGSGAGGCPKGQGSREDGYVQGSLKGEYHPTSAARVWHSPLFWGLSMLVFLLMSLGPLLQIGGTNTGIPLPAYLFYRLPFVRISRVPIRFVVVVMLTLGVLASWGTRFLLCQIGQQAARPLLAMRVLLAVLIGLVVLDNYVPPFPMIGIYVPPVYAELRDEPGDFALLEMPFYERTSVLYMFYQAVHGKPLVGGNLSRHQVYPLMEQFPIVRMYAYAAPARDIIGQDMEETASSLFTYFRIRYLILHSEGGALRYNTTVKVARAAAGGADPQQVKMPGRSFLLFRVQEPAEPLPFLGVGEGWSMPQDYEHGAVLRSIVQQSGEVLVYSAKPASITLDIRLHSEQEGSLSLSANGEPLGEHALVPGVQHIQVSLDVAAGSTSLHLTPAGAGGVAVERVTVE